MTLHAIQQSFDLALQHHRAGRLQAAEQIYRQILAQHPRHHEVLHLLGVIAHQVGRNDAAVELMRRAVALKPDFPEALNNLGLALRAAGQHDQGIATFRRAIALSPGFADPYSNLGNALRDQGQLDEAIAACRAAIAINPNDPGAHNNLGNALGDKGRVDEAIGAYRQAIAVAPGVADAHCNLGATLFNLGRNDEAIAEFRTAIALRPNFPEARNNLGNALRGKGNMAGAIAALREAIAQRPNFADAYITLGITLRESGLLDEAVAVCRRAVALKPNDAAALGALGNALNERCELDEAIAAYRQAVTLKPGYHEAYSNLGDALREMGDPDAAVDACRQALALKPDFHAARANLGLALLLKGDWEHGWPEYESRRSVAKFPSPFEKMGQLQWDGSDLANRTILIHAEQGFGDTIQFIRFVPLIAERGATVVFQCDPILRRLLHKTPGIAQWLDPAETIPRFDVHSPLLSIPLPFGATPSSIPRAVPYVHADPENVERWREKMADDRSAVKVGLAWAGSPTHRRDRNRSMSLAALAPLAQVKGVSFYSLQKGEAGKQAANALSGLELFDWTQDLNDFADTAALIANLDLVISVDTVVVHLAGAMGKPVWTMLPFVPDWRWLMEGEHSDWYPTMRLFRQRARGDWTRVASRVADELSRWVNEPNARAPRTV